MADSLSLFGPAEFQEETPLEAVSPNMPMQFDPETDIKDIVPAVQGNLDQLGSNDVSTLPADVAPNPLINSRELTHGMDPVRTSKVLTLSRESGLPPRVVEQHVDEMERRRTIPDEKLDLIQNQYPQTAQLLSDPDFFAVAQDDIDRLTALEGTIRQYNPGAWERIGTKWEESRQQLEDGVRGFALGALSSYVQLADEEEAGGFVPNSGVKALRELARGALAHVQAKHDVEKAKRTAPLLPAENNLQQYVEDFVGASAPILATMAITALTRSPYAGSAFMATQIAGGDYLARKEQGASDVAAFGSGLADAALQAPLEALSLGKFFNIFKATGGAQILKTVATALGTEFTTEFLQKFPEDLTEDLALIDVRGQDVWDALGGFLDNLDETAKAGLYEGLLSAPWAPLGGAGQVVRDYSNMRATEQEQTILDSLTQDIAQTNLAQLDPVLHQQALQILASGSQIENVFIDSQAFEAAYGQDVAGQARVLDSLGISQEAYQNAVATGEELTVQFGNYASTVAAFPEFANKLANDRKLSKQGLTRNEWLQTQQELAKTYQDILIQSQEEVQAAAQEDAETKAIYEQVYAARQAAGRVPDAARLDAAQFTAALVSMAKMSEGKYTATQLFEAYMPQVRAGQTGVDQQTPIDPQTLATLSTQLSTLQSAWDRANRAGRNVEWMVGAAEANPIFESLGPEAMNIPAHGMAKAVTLQQGLKDLLNILNNGIDPSRTLYTAGLTAPTGSGAGTGTAGGYAYRDGPFIITFREGVVGSPTNSDITGVLVNSAHPELVAPLQQMFPNLVIRDYNNVADVVSASRAGTSSTSATAEQKTPSTQDLLDVHEEQQDFDKGKMLTRSTYEEKDGIGYSTYINPETGIVDVYLAGFSGTDFYGYMRVYENGKPTNKFTSKLARETKREGASRAMISRLVEMLPEGHMYMENDTISIDGMRHFENQLRNGYTPVLDQAGKIETSTARLSNAGKTSLLEGAESSFTGMEIKTEEQFEKVRQQVAPYLEKLGLDPETSIRWDGTNAVISMPVLQAPRVQRGGQAAVDQQALQQDAAYAGVENEAEVEEAGRLWAEMGTESPYFKRWSGGAPVVRRGQDHDFQTGQSVVVESDHGSPDARFVQEDGIFKSEKERYGFGRSEAAHWFTRDTATAKTYADPRRAFDYQNAEPGVIPAFVRLDNPLVIDAGGQNWRDAQKRGKTGDVIKEARENGHDGVIITGVKDDYNNDRKTKTTTTLTVFSSAQIKSATNNRGTFDPADARIQYQAQYAGAQTAAEVEEAGRLWAEMGTESPYFKRWFGESKVVDDSGKPLVVYKAMYPYDWTKEDKATGYKGPEVEAIKRTTPFPAFNNGEPGVEIAGFFGDVDTANGFAERAGKGQALYPVYLSFRKPFVLDAKGRFAGDTQFGASGKPFRDAIRSGKYDGVIIKNTKDEGTIYVALDPTQIKSATGNRGTFDPADARILYQRADAPAEQAIAQDLQGRGVDTGALFQNQGQPQAAFTFKTKSGRPLIELFRTANQSSFLHETGHLYLEMVRELALQENAPAPVTALWAQTKAALKIDDGPISREAHEEWARNLEAYFLEGAAPSLGLRKIFAQYAQWLRSIYKQVEQIFLQSGTQFNEDLKPIFDRIFATEKDIEEARSFYSSQKPFFAALDPKVMAKERQKYEERRMRARESMEDKRLRQLTDAWVKASGGKAKIRAEVTEEVKALPVVAVLAALSSGGAGSIKNENLVSALREDPIDPAEYVWVFGTDWAASDSDAVRAAIQEMEDISGRVSAAAAERDSKLEEYEAVIGRIRKLGGIRADTVKESLGKDLAEDIRKKFGTGIVTKDGMPLDEVAMVLQERAGGYGFDGYPETVIDYLSSPYSLTKTQINKDFSDVSSSAKARIKELETLVSNDATRKKAKEDEAAALREAPSGVFKKGGKLPGEVAKKLGFETTSELYSALREYQAQRDTKSFNMKALDASVGEDLRKQLKAIGRYSSLVKKEGTVDPDILAAENGYDSAVAMVEDLISFPGEKAAITAGVEVRMEAERQRISRGLAETDLAADEAYHNDDQLAVLVAEFEILSQQAAQKTKRLEASMVRDVAKQLLASEKVNFATQSSRFARLERRAAKLARAAYERGDAKAAAEYKRQEVLNHAMFIESVALKEGVAKTAARIKRGIQKTKGISPEVKTLLQGLGIQYGILPYKKERDPVRAFEMWNQDLVAKGGKIPTIEGWVDEMRKLGISAPLDPFLNNAAAVGYKDITVGQFRSLEEGVRVLRRVDKNLHTVTLPDGTVATIEDVVEMAKQYAAGRGGKTPDPLIYDPSKVGQFFRGATAELTKTATIIQALDNYEFGGFFYSLLYRPIMDADTALSSRWADVAPKIKALFEPVKRQLAKKVVVLGKARTRAQLVAVALNTGNAGNRERLMAGLGINEAQLQQFLDPLTVEEMDFVQSVWDYIDTFRDEAFAVERRLTGREPKRVEPVPFTFKGKAYAGGYYPVAYDKLLRDQRGEARDTKEAIDALFGGMPSGTAMTAHGHLESRASAGTGERLSQELTTIADHITQVLRDITHREAVVNVAKLLKNKAFAAVITDVVGREKAQQLWPWLVSVSKEGKDQVPLNVIEKGLLHFRPAMTFYIQAYKVGTALLQMGGFFQTFEFVPAKHVGQAVWQLYGKGTMKLNLFKDGELISNPLIAQIKEKSPQMAERLLNADRDIRDATKEFSTSESWLAAYKKGGFKATIAMQFYAADVVAWQGAYLQALAEGKTEKDAINYADWVVEQAMGAGYTRALAKLQRGGSIQRFFTMFYTFGNTLFNLAARRAGITKKQLRSGQYGAAALGASSFLVLQWVMPVLLEALVRGDVGDDDDDALAEKILVNLWTYPAQTLPIVRELSGIAKGFKYRASPAFTPFESMTKWISAVGKAIEEEDASLAVKPTAQLVGTTTGLIPAQFINSGEVLTDYLTGEDQELSVKELLYGKGGRK